MTRGNFASHPSGRKGSIHNILSSLERDLIWPIVIKPQADESFSSWFTRQTHALATTPLQLLRDEGIVKRRIYSKTFDMDTKFKESWIKEIGKLTGLESQLRDMYSLPIKKTKSIGKWNFITEPVNGSRYCPFCLANDPISYFRYSWRLKFVTICPPA